MADDNPNSRPLANAPVPPTGAERPALDANDLPELDRDPDTPDKETDVASDSSFPASDASAPAQPGRGTEPVPSSGYPADTP